MLRRFVATVAIAIAFGASIGSASAASPVGGRCGGFAGFRCNPGLACRLPQGGADRMGVCVPGGGEDGPRACPRIFRPVCGRDGRTYSNDCVLRANKVGFAHPGRC